MLTRLVTTLLASLATTAACAQDLTPSAPPQTAPIFLVGATVHTVSGETIEKGVVSFNNGQIGVVGDMSVMSRISLSPDTTVIDLNGKHIYPGLIAAYSRLGLVEIDAVRATRDFSETGAMTPEVRSVVAVNPDSTQIPVARLSGVLIAATFPTGGRMPGRGGVIRTDGWTWEDMAITQDVGLFINWPSVRPNTNSWTSTDAKEQRERISRQLDSIDEAFAAANDYAKAKTRNAATPTDIALDAIATTLPVETTNAGAQHPVFIGADDMDQITSAVRWAVGRGLKPIIVGGQDADRVANLLVQHNVPVIIRGAFNFPKRADAPYDDPFTLAQRLEAAGVDWCMGPTSIDWNMRNLAHNAAKAVAHGLDHARAVRSITLDPARILGIADRYGSIQSGKSATLIVTDADVLDGLSIVEHAWIDGRKVELRSKQTELAEKYAEKYRQLGSLESPSAND